MTNDTAATASFDNDAVASTAMVNKGLRASVSNGPTLKFDVFKGNIRSDNYCSTLDHVEAAAVGETK